MIFITVGLALAGIANADFLDYPLVESGIGALQASSEYSPSFSASRAVLNFDTSREGGQGWTPAYNDMKQWLQISSQTIVRWTSLQTQGRGNHDSWVTSFTIEYNLNGKDWEEYDNNRIFFGNDDRNSIVTHDFDIPLIARAIRIVPLTWNIAISMRVEAYVNDDLEDFEYEPDGTIVIPAIDSGLLLTSSSEHNPSHDVSRARLHFNTEREGAMGWVPAVYDLNQWIQISSQFSRKWVKISTQGRADYDAWVSSYYISYSPDGIVWYQTYEGRIFPANYNRNTVVTHIFDEPFEAKVIRIHPVTWYQHIAMRLEVYFEESKDADKPED